MIKGICITGEYSFNSYYFLFIISKPYFKYAKFKSWNCIESKYEVKTVCVTIMSKCIIWQNHAWHFELTYFRITYINAQNMHRITKTHAQFLLSNYCLSWNNCSKSKSCNVMVRNDRKDIGIVCICMRLWYDAQGFLPCPTVLFEEQTKRNNSPNII